MKRNSYDKRDFKALQNSGVPAFVMASKGCRFDSEDAASVFFARELDYVKAQSYDVEYPELTALTLFPISSEADEGAETVTYYTYDKTGLAKVISNYSTDLPRADVDGKPTTAFIKSLGASYGYSAQEMRASRLAGKSLDARKAESARYAIDNKNNIIKKTLVASRLCDATLSILLYQEGLTLWSPAVRIIRPQSHPFPRILFEPCLLCQRVEDLTQDAHAAVVRRCTHFGSHTSEILTDHLRRHTGKIFNRQIAVFHPSGKLKPNIAFTFKRRSRQFIPIR